VSVQPSLVFEEVAQRSGNLPPLIPLWASRRRPGEPKHLPAQLNKLPVGVASSIVYQLELK
jgi:hypothetical protein